MFKLGVNVDHVATVRQQRKGEFPDPVLAARLAEQAGAHSVVCHLREDRRHIQERDLRLLKQTIHTHLNLEMAANDDVIKIALDVKPNSVTLVPEKREELTTEGGLDVLGSKQKLTELTRRFHDAGIIVSMFIEPARDQLEASKEVRADAIEIHTGRYADAKNKDDRSKEAARISVAAMLGKNLRFDYIACGHGLDYNNVATIAMIPEIVEFNIGFSIISRSLYVGIERAVKEMLDKLAQSRLPQ